MRFKFGNQKLYIVPGTDHCFRTKQDAEYYCEQHGIDTATIEKYDSKKEYDRWQELQILQRAGEISELRRQVEYEIIPAMCWPTCEDKIVKYWYAGGTRFATKKEAAAYCREQNLPQKTITSEQQRVTIYKAKCIMQNAVYTADFVYRDKQGNEVVEDVKSAATRKEADYVLRRKLMLHVHGILVKEV